MRLGARSLSEFAQVTPIRPNSTQFDQFEAVGARFDPGTGADVATGYPTVSSRWLYGFMDSLSPGRIYGTTSLDTGTNWCRLVPPPLFPTLWLAGQAGFVLNIRG